MPYTLYRVFYHSFFDPRYPVFVDQTEKLAISVKHGAAILSEQFWHVAQPSIYTSARHQDGFAFHDSIWRNWRNSDDVRLSVHAPRNVSHGIHATWFCFLASLYDKRFPCASHIGYRFLTFLGLQFAIPVSP